MRLTAPFVIAGLVFVAAPAAAQDDGHRIVVRDVVRDDAGRRLPGRNNGPEQTERFSRKVKIGRDGRFSLSNISGDIIGHRRIGRRGVDRGGQADARRQERAGRRADHRRRPRRGASTSRPNHGQNADATGTAAATHVSVDYTVTLPASASVDLHSVSGIDQGDRRPRLAARRDDQRRRDDHRRAASSRPPRPCRATCR